ncbi:MAG: accessory factor UbiK family protein [Proteobacteria bacterium]|nr:accessory factor UbiK family protein [Pseudomonadota bacterium]
MQTRSRLLHDLTRVAGGAMSTAVGAKDEIEALLRNRLDRLVQRLDLVAREELEAIRAVAVRAREEQERLGERMTELERQVEALSSGPKPAGSKAAGSKAAGGKAAGSKAAGQKVAGGTRRNPSQAPGRPPKAGRKARSSA